MGGPEKTFQDRIMPLLKSLPESFWFKVQKAEGGIPDVVGWIRGRAFCLELKRDRRHKPTKLQLYQMGKAKDAGAICWVVCPETWDEQFENLARYAKAGSF